MEKIILRKSVIDFLDELVITLLKEEYFSYIETSEAYVDCLFDFIYNDLPNTKHRETPKVLLKHGP